VPNAQGGFEPLADSTFVTAETATDGVQRWYVWPGRVPIIDGELPGFSSLSHKGNGLHFEGPQERDLLRRTSVATQGHGSWTAA